MTVSAQLPSDQCSVCTVGGVNDTTTSCHSSLSLEPGQEAKLLFNCSQSFEQAYTVTITRTIGELIPSCSCCVSALSARVKETLWRCQPESLELRLIPKLECTQDACSPSTVETQPALLKELTRTFTWELKAPEKVAVGLDVLGDGLRETSQPCPNGLQYSVATSKSTSKAQTQYCQGGSLTRFDLLEEAVISLKVKANVAVTSMLFQASAGPLSKNPFSQACDPPALVTHPLRMKLYVNVNAEMVSGRLATERRLQLAGSKTQAVARVPHLLYFVLCFLATDLILSRDIREIRV